MSSPRWFLLGLLFFFYRSVPGVTPVPEDVRLYLKRHLPGYALVAEEDYRPDIRAAIKPANKDALSIFSIDLNGDGRADYVLLLLNREKRQIGIFVLIARRNGYKSLVLSKTSWKGVQPQPVCRVLELKKDGEKGISHHANFEKEVPEDRRLKSILQYQANFAIEVSVPNEGNSEFCGATAAADFRCSEGYYWDKRGFKSEKVCD
jgi:hypothetical protein